MRALLVLSLGLVLSFLAAPAVAGTLADYRASSGNFNMENGVRVYRVLVPKPQYYNTQTANYVSERAFEHGYQYGFESGFDLAQKKATKTHKKRKTRRNRYNYGRRYTTSGANPRYSRFLSDIGYIRPAYISNNVRN
jgi:hypothetical protein